MLSGGVFTAFHASQKKVAKNGKRKPSWGLPRTVFAFTLYYEVDTNMS